MRERRRKFTPEFKDEAVKMVIESSRPVAEVAREIQVNEGTLGNWVHRYRLDHVGEEPPLSIPEMSPTGRCPRTTSTLPERQRSAAIAHRPHPAGHPDTV